jgi:hypothetical protein
MHESRAQTYVQYAMRIFKIPIVYLFIFVLLYGSSNWIHIFLISCVSITFELHNPSTWLSFRM